MTISVPIPGVDTKRTYGDYATSVANQVGDRINLFLDKNGNQSDVKGFVGSAEDRAFATKAVNTRQAVFGITNYLMNVFLKNMVVRGGSHVVREADRFVWPSKEIGISRNVYLDSRPGEMSSLDEDSLRMQAGVVERGCREMQEIVMAAKNVVGEDSTMNLRAADRGKAESGLRDVKSKLDGIKKKVDNDEKLDDFDWDLLVKSCDGCESSLGSFELSTSGIQNAVDRARLTKHLVVRNAILNGMIEAVDKMLKAVDSAPAGYLREYGDDDKLLLEKASAEIQNIIDVIGEGIGRLGKNEHANKGVLDLFSTKLPNLVADFEKMFGDINEVIKKTKKVLKDKRAVLKKTYLALKEKPATGNPMADKENSDDMKKVLEEMRNIIRKMFQIRRFGRAFDFVKKEIGFLVPNDLLIKRLVNALDGILSNSSLNEKLRSFLTDLKKKLTGGKTVDDDDLLAVVKKLDSFVDRKRGMLSRLSKFGANKVTIGQIERVVSALSAERDALSAILMRNQLSNYGDSDETDSMDDDSKLDDKGLAWDQQKVDIPSSVVRRIVEEAKNGKLKEYYGKSIIDWIIEKGIPGYEYRDEEETDPKTGKPFMSRKLYSLYQEKNKIPRHVIETYRLQNVIILFNVLREYYLKVDQKRRNEYWRLQREDENKERMNKGLPKRPSIPPDTTDPINHVKVALSRKELRRFLKWLNNQGVDFDVQDIDPNQVEKAQKDAWKISDESKIRGTEGIPTSSSELIHDDMIQLNGDTIYQAVGLMSGRAIETAKRMVSDDIVSAYNRRNGN